MKNGLKKYKVFFYFFTHKNKYTENKTIYNEADYSVIIHKMLSLKNNDSGRVTLTIIIESLKIGKSFCGFRNDNKPHITLIS